MRQGNKELLLKEQTLLTAPNLRVRFADPIPARSCSMNEERRDCGCQSVGPHAAVEV